MEDTKCFICKKEFRRKKSQLLLAKRHYCSISCQNLGKKKGKIIACLVCHKKVYKKNKDLLSSQSKKYFCSIKCSNHWLGVQNRGQSHPNWKTGEFSYRDLLSRASSKKSCRLCNTSDNRILLVHHVDQNRKNNELKNLIWLCCNCHFLVHHYGGELRKLENMMKNYAYP